MSAYDRQLTGYMRAARLWARLGLLVALVLPGAARADDLRVFFFGNSLIHHLTDSDETALPHWLAQMSQASGQGFAADGVWGFPVDFARNLPPEPNWQFAQVPSALDGRAFRMAGLTDIVLNPANFIQADPPSAPVQEGSATELAARVFDWADGQAPAARLWLYEGWSDMNAAGYPPSARGLRRWHAYNTGDAHQWYRTWQAEVAADLGRDVGLIPAGSVLSHLLSEEPWSTIPVTDLYSDVSPHGTATVYLLAAMVTHVSLRGTLPPAPPLSDAIHPVVADNWDATAQRIFALTTGAILPQGARLSPPETGLPDPWGAAGLAGLSDWSTQLPFLDLMKTARPWTGHLPGQWGGMDAAALMAGGHLSPQGWPLSIPENLDAIETYVLTDLPAATQGAAGRYVLRWQGQGELSVGGIAQDIDWRADEIRFSFRPGPGPVAIRIDSVDPADPIRNITLVREDRLDLWEGGAIFNPDWLAHVADLRAIRFMDWMGTNGSPQRTWADRPLPGDYTWAWRGVPVEVMVALANQIGADPWFTLPHQADDAYATAFATHVRDHLDPRLTVHAEWSNEVWNWIFPQAQWAADQAAARWGTAEGDAWMQFAGTRAAEVADLWRAVFAATPDRLVTVIATHTGWPGLESALLDAPLRVAEGLAPPVTSFGAYAITGYLGYDAGAEDRLDQLRRWAGQGRDAAIARLTDSLQDDDLPLLRDQWDHHAAVAAERGLSLLMYEGGTHVMAQGAAIEDPVVTDLLIAMNYSPQMAALYATMIADWRALGAGPFMAFVDVAAPSKWGSWGHARWLGDANPRAVTVAGWASLPPPDGTAPRAPGTFDHGLIRQGTPGPDRVEGTVEPDDLLAGAGDDLLIAGPGDRLHGGAGDDTALLPGTAANWQLVPDGAATLALGPAGQIRLVDVEFLAFADAPDSPQPLAPAN